MRRLSRRSLWTWPWSLSTRYADVATTDADVPVAVDESAVTAVAMDVAIAMVR